MTRAKSRCKTWLGLGACYMAVLAGQLVFFAGELHNRELTQSAPDSSDAEDYAERARALGRTGDLASSLGDAHRPPLYPLFLAALMATFGQPLLVARIIQMAALAAVPLLIFHAARRATGRSGTAVCVAALALCWLPMYYFGPLLLAESLSILLLSCLMVTLVHVEERPTPLQCALLGAVLAALTLLKANHLLLAIPVLAFVGHRGIEAVRLGKPKSMLARRATYRGAAASCLLVLVVLAASVAPWSVFASVHNGGFVPLTTTQGFNLYLGTLEANHAHQPGTLMHRVAAAISPAGEPARPRLDIAVSGPLSIEEAHEYQSTAVSVWRDRPAASLAYAAAKVGHVFGASFRGLRDVVLFLQSGVAVAAAVWLWRQRTFRPWCTFFAATTLVLAAQAAAFLPNQRFRVVGFDTAALFVIGLAMVHYACRQRSAAGRSSSTFPVQATVQEAA